MVSAVRRRSLAQVNVRLRQYKAANTIGRGLRLASILLPTTFVFAIGGRSASQIAAFIPSSARGPKLRLRATRAKSRQRQGRKDIFDRRPTFECRMHDHLLRKHIHQVDDAVIEMIEKRLNIRLLVFSLKKF